MTMTIMATMAKATAATNARVAERKKKEKW
jgi:hypothetical protein